MEASNTASSEAPVTRSLDERAESLDALVRPVGWSNPRPAAPYDLVVIGGGTAGLVSAVGAAGLGARVALIERERLGGDCLNTGCVPSKAILRTARAIADARRGAELAIRVDGVHVEFAAVMQRMRARRLRLAPNDSARRLADLGVHVFFGEGAFANSREITVGGQTLRFGRAVIASGSRPAVPPIDGLAQTPYLTSDTVFDLEQRPRRLLVIGAGAVGCELSQAFARLGSDVVLFDQSARVLVNDDPDAAAIVQSALARDGVTFELATTITHVSRRGDQTVVRFTRGPDEEPAELAGDCLLVAAGRSATIAELTPEQAGIRLDSRGRIIVDDRLRTSNRRVYAAGDVCSRFQFTHAADAMARIVLQNALFFGRRKASALTIPWCTYTDPELAHVGHVPHAASEPTADVQTISVPWSEVDRAVLDDETEGFVRVHHRGGRLLGCTIVGAHAGDMIGQAASAIRQGTTLTDFAATVFPYPTRVEAFRKAGDAYNRTRVTATVRRLFERYFQLTRW